MTCPQSIKFLKLKRRLGLPHWQVVGVLESLWLFTQMNAPRGDIGKQSNEDIAAGMEWGGDSDRLVRDLIDCGFLDECDKHRLLIHDWADHLPTYLKGAMAKNGIELAKQSARHSAKQNGKHDAKHGQTVVEQPAPSLVLSGVGLPCQSVTEDSCSEPPNTDDSKPTKADEPIAENFPPVECVGKVKSWRMTTAKLFEWRESFPTVDVDLEIRKAYQWLRDNQAKRKTASGMPTFIGRWLTKATNSHGGQGGAAKPIDEETRKRNSVAYLDDPVKMAELMRGYTG